MKYELLRPPRWVGARPHPSLGGGVVNGARASWVILDVKTSRSRYYPCRLLIGAIAPEEADALVAAGARAFSWRWDRRRVRR